jgi:hypothetical protein
MKQCPKHGDSMIPKWSAKHGYHMRCSAGGIIEPEDVGWACEFVGEQVTKQEYEAYWGKW